MTESSRSVLSAPAHGHDLTLREALRRGRLDEAGALARIGADVGSRQRAQIFLWLTSAPQLNGGQT
jgi:hypothetical protein